jgi:hypothetical protein
MNEVLQTLLGSSEPAVRWKTLAKVLGRSAEVEDAIREREAIRTSERVQKLLSQRDADGRIPGSPYTKWTGAHWVLSDLANLDYPPGDESLLPLRDQVYEGWLSPTHTKERVIEKESKAAIYADGVPVIRGRARRCASQEGNALYSTLALGIEDGRANRLAENLLRWQWPDGGWNCDKNPEADTSSFMETLLPMRGLAWHARLARSSDSADAAEKAAEVFLKRRLFRRISDGEVIHPDFTCLHYPPYWHYDILFVLKVMAEAGFIGDPRCSEALDLLEDKRLPDGGFPAEAKFYRVSEKRISGNSLVDWGVTRKKQMNEFVTVDALYVLRKAGRFQPSYHPDK